MLPYIAAPWILWVLKLLPQTDLWKQKWLLPQHGNSASGRILIAMLHFKAAPDFPKPTGESVQWLISTVRWSKLINGQWMNMAHLWMIYLLNMAIFHGCVKLSNGFKWYVKYRAIRTLFVCVGIIFRSSDPGLRYITNCIYRLVGHLQISNEQYSNIVMPQNFICIPAQRETEQCWGFGKFSATCVTTPKDHFFFAARRPGPRFWEPYSSSRLGSQNLGCKRARVESPRHPQVSSLETGTGFTGFQAAMRAPKRVTLVWFESICGVYPMFLEPPDFEKNPNGGGLVKQLSKKKLLKTEGNKFKASSLAMQLLRVPVSVSPNLKDQIISHRIHGAGIYANMTGVYWWDPCYHTQRIHGAGIFTYIDP